ncbi:FAD-dependent monooxygenase [Sphingobacterium sp. lm-10]|uniref:FAD-dependent monooxygenase n=1 Tax=Sphingobacterium sp. lm-10 TaxID=2944904 RepID=UPI0020202B22|nr:FAD-dependent monooxygenase [Sphingobacterium sp. lm-10]MCL7988186.1 FAD-dependent monooxygenase [Sphingobacterium sp. lm-10]
MKSIDCEFAIIGGGVAGLSMGIALSSIAKDFLIFEQAEVLRGIGAGFGLAANAMRAFDYLGLRQEAEQIGFYTETYNILDDRGRVLIAPDTERLGTQYNQKNLTVHRADLHRFLQSKIQDDQLLLGKRVQRYEQQKDSISLFFQDGSTYHCRYLIVADGVKSPIRQQLIPASKPRYAGYTCWRATIDNTGIGLQHGSETWGTKGRFGMTPLVHNRVYWYACINAKAQDDTFKNYTPDNLLRHFGDYHAPIPEIIRQTAQEDLIWNDIIDIKPLSQFAYGPILLIGDAAHATTPNMGQGACQALEDVAVLTDELKKSQSAELAFIHFERRRLARTRYITDTSWQIGKIAQWSNPILVPIRNAMMRAMPAKWSEASLNKLLKQDFLTINSSL